MSEEVISPLLPEVECDLLTHFSPSSQREHPQHPHHPHLHSRNKQSGKGGDFRTMATTTESESRIGEENGVATTESETNGMATRTNVDEGRRSTTTLVPESSSHPCLVLALIFVLSVIALFWVYSTFPNLEPNEKQYIKLPRNIEDAKMLGGVLNRYKEKYYMKVLCGVFAVYIFLQTFAIPGSIFLSILAGFLFQFWLALFLVCFCSATGASFCYGLSLMVGRRLILKHFPDRVESWSRVVSTHRDNLLNYIIFLRITPFLPNWFINIASPVIGVPLVPFWLGTFIGVAPPSFVAIQAGTTLNQLSSSSDALSWTSLSVLLVLGGLSLIPVLMKDDLKKKFE